MKGSAFFLFSLSASAHLIGAHPQCDPKPPATCYPDDCCRTYCYGPTNVGISAPVRPYTCDGDWVITASGFYWNAHMDGMEYAIETQVNNTALLPVPESAGPIFSFIPERTSLIGGEYKSPDFKWNFGFKFGVGYNTTCDGWDIGAVWTRYHGKAHSHDEAENDDNRSLLPLWSDFNFIETYSLPQIEPFFLPPAFNLPLYATDIQAEWNVHLDLIDLELGREFWNSRRLTLRPHIGLRIASIKQEYDIAHKGGSWSEIKNPGTGDVLLPNRNNHVELENNYKGIGMRGGLDTVWNFGCGWAIFGNTAFSLLYGRFDVDQNEHDREAETPFQKTKIVEAKDSLRASRFVGDFAIGVQWSSLFCDCQYALAVKLGWENHIFFDQNQLWRANKVKGGYEFPQQDILGIHDPHKGGYVSLDQRLINFQDPHYAWNNFFQRRGSLDTQGWTLTVIFDF